MARCRHDWTYISMTYYKCSKCGVVKTKQLGGRWYYWRANEPFTWYHKRRASW